MAGAKLNRWPGYVATGLLTLATTLWTLWGVGEMYYEGWWGAWYNRLPYLGPPAICLAFTLIALTWPRLGGGIILLLGGAFTAWRWIRQAQLGPLTWPWMLSWFPVSGVLVIVGILFWLEGRHRRERCARGWTPPRQWLRRNLRYVVALVPPLLTAVSVTAYFAPLLLARYDSGERSAQRIQGNGVTLIWAPAGPGWNWRPWGHQGRWLSWDDIALYGLPPVGLEPTPKWERLGRHATQAEMAAAGLCRYLSADGTALMHEPQDIWRMPTADAEGGTHRSPPRRDAGGGAALSGRRDRAMAHRLRGHERGDAGGGRPLPDRGVLPGRPGSGR